MQEEPAAQVQPVARLADFNAEDFLTASAYDNHIVKKEEGKSIRLVQTLYKYYLENIDLLPQDYLQLLDRGTPREIVVCDYIASMSDKFVIANFESLYIPRSWQV